MSMPTAMNMLPTSLARHFSRNDEREALVVLGEGHVLTRALGVSCSVARQLLVTSIVVALAGVGWTVHLRQSPLVLAAGALVGVVLLAALRVVRRRIREQAQELISAGYAVPSLRSIDAERRRLCARTARERAARRLERLVSEALDWPRYSAPSRPLPEIRRLAPVAPELQQVAALLRSESVHVTGVARAMRLLDGGTDSVLFSGDVERVRRELELVRWRLGYRSVVSDDERLAA
jgi:hypothetical protein